MTDNVGESEAIAIGGVDICTLKTHWRLGCSRVSKNWTEFCVTNPICDGFGHEKSMIPNFLSSNTTLKVNL